MTKRFFAFLLALGAVPGLAGMETTVDADPTADFTRFKTFAWVQSSATPVAAVTHERIVAAVNRELDKKGLTLTDQDPDLLLIYDGSAKEEFQPEQVVRGHGQTFFSGVGWYKQEAKYFRKGTLILRIADAREKKLVWHGTASDAVKEAPEKNLKKIDEAVRKLLAKFPPAKR